MKKQFSLKRGMMFLSCALLLGSITVSSCKKDKDNNNTSNMYTLSGNANGGQVVPAVAGNGTGTITGTYNASTNTLNYNVGWNGLSGNASSVGFYGGAASGANGTQIGNNVAITTAGATGGAVGTMTLTPAQAADLLAGRWYYLVGTPTNSTGEVRGQIVTAQ
jgi:hypothetical protein